MCCCSVGDGRVEVKVKKSRRNGKAMGSKKARSDAKRSRMDSQFLRQGIGRALLTANAHRPVGNSRVLLVPSFMSAWIYSEIAPLALTTSAIRTARALRRKRRVGEPLNSSDVLGLALTGAAAVGTVGLIRDSLRTNETMEASLAGLIPQQDLDARPRSVRAGAVIPLIAGNRRRRRTRNVVYTKKRSANPETGITGSPDLKLDVYLPLDDVQPGEKRPAILQIHGGAWVLGSKNEQGIPLLNHLASCGWVGFNIDYRLWPKAKYPDHVVDCKLALAWIREHAEEYGVDPNFIAVTGGSAGGHLCAMTALTEGDPVFQPGFEDADTSVQAAVPFYGVYDLKNEGKYYGGDRQHDIIIKLMQRFVMGMPLTEDEDAWRSYSPIDRVTEDSPPMFVIHGDKDVLVPVSMGRALARKLRGISKNPVAYAELHGAQHAFEVFPSIRTMSTVEYVERFLNHIHSEYLAKEADADADAPVPDDQ